MSILVSVAKFAADAGLRYFVVGGNAVIAHGYQRGTKDFDLLVLDSDLMAWETLILSLGYVRTHASRAFEMYVSARGETAPIDLVVVDASTFSKFAAVPETVIIEGVEVEVPRLSHLLALKLHALRSYHPHRFERDMGDVVTLMRLHRVDLADPEYEAIFERYATPAIRQELERRLGGPDFADR